MTIIKSEIIPFYSGKNIFLTGATGFVGKLVIDQLLRKCQPNKIYLLIRPKRGVEPKQRVEQLFQDVVYERLRKEKPNFMENIELINGDLSEDGLGINEESRKKIIENVSIVIHGGATVKFDEEIRKATSINVKGTLSVVKLCHQILNLEAFLYVSTAFSNCPYDDVKEEFYDPPVTCDELIELTETKSHEELEEITPRIFGKWPNSYSLTKSVAENAIKKYAKGLPVSVFRPAIIVGTHVEPTPGWIDNIYGPTGVLAGIAAGVIRVVHADPEASACIVPADMVAFAIVAATFKTSQMGPTNEAPIYNYVISKDNAFTWFNYVDLCDKVGAVMPISQSVWKYSYRLEKNYTKFVIYSFFLHFLPAFLIDIVLRVLNKTPKAMKAVQKVDKFMAVLSYFALKTWKFSNNNVEALWSGLNSEDKKLFNFDMNSIDWNDYFKTAIPGIRLYIFKETPDTIPNAIKKRQRQEMIETTIAMFLIGCLAWIIWSYVSRMIAITT